MSELPTYARTLGLAEEPQDDGPPLLVHWQPASVPLHLSMLVEKPGELMGQCPHS